MNRVEMLGINPTYKCNLDCLMCGQRHMPIADINREVDYADLCSFIDAASKPVPRYGVYIWGGEPLMYSHFDDLLGHLRERRIFATVNTNGTLLERHAERIVREGVQRVIVSIDGDEATHDRIRGHRGTFAKVARGVAALARWKSELGRPVPIIASNTVVTSENYDRLVEILDVIAELGVNKLECQLPIFFDEATGQRYERRMERDLGCAGASWRGFRGDYADVDVEVLIGQVEAIRARFGRKFALSPNLDADGIRAYFTDPDSVSPDKTCTLPFGQIHTEPSGDCVVCPDFPDYIFGNIGTDSFEEIWAGTRIEAFRSAIRLENLPVCSRCCQFYAF